MVKDRISVGIMTITQKIFLIVFTLNIMIYMIS